MQRKQNCRNPFQRGTEIRTGPLKRSAAAAGEKEVKKGERRKNGALHSSVLYINGQEKETPKRRPFAPKKKRVFFKYGSGLVRAGEVEESRF